MPILSQLGKLVFCLCIKEDERYCANKNVNYLSIANPHSRVFLYNCVSTFSANMKNHLDSCVFFGYTSIFLL